jgi:hypothetical protein
MNDLRQNAMRKVKVPRGATDRDVTSPRAADAMTDEETASLEFRGHIFRPDKGYRPRSLLEPRLYAGVGAVLNKREWWTKRRRGDGAIRDKWLAEFEHKLIAQTFESSTEGWSLSSLGEALPLFLAGYKWRPQDGSDDEKRAFVHKVCSTFPYNLIWHGNDWWDELEEGLDANAERFDEETAEEFDERNEKMESYGQITWYVELLRWTKTLRGMPLDQWKVPAEFNLGTEEAVASATEFILAVHRGEVTKETFNDCVADGDHREQLVDALRVHVDRIMSELEEIR